MDYNKIKEIINNDYDSVYQASSGGRGTKKTFYQNFLIALDELHNAVGPFVVGKDEFIEYIKYLKSKVSPGVYEIILTYCRDNLKLDI